VNTVGIDSRFAISLSVRLLIVWLLIVVVGTLAPFDFTATTPVHAHSFRLFQHGAYERDPVDFTLNVILFTPLGALLFQQMNRRAFRLGSIVASTVTAGLVISSSLEYFQQFVPSRDSSLLDVVANTVGGVLGIFLVRSWGAAVEARIAALRGRTSPSALAGTLASFLAVALILSGTLQARSRLSNWSAGYPLLVGNERTGDRPWRGRVFGLTITDSATSHESLRRFAGGEPITVAGTPVAAFTLDGTPPYRDAARHLPALVWTDLSHDATADGIALTGAGRWLQTEGAAADLALRLPQSNAFSIRLQCATADVAQRGPARIISNSVSPYFRNFTVGQQGPDLVFRLRTLQTGLNGFPLEAIVPNVFAAADRRDIAISYDGAFLLTAVAQGGSVFHTELGPATFLAPFVGAALPQKLGADPLRVSKVIYLSAFFLPPGVLIAVLGRTRAERLRLFGTYLLTATVLLEAALVAASGRPIRLTEMAFTAGIGSLVLALMWAILAIPDPTLDPVRARWVSAETLS